MGQCFLYGSGGGAGLRVVSGLTAPTSPLKNAVWVKSDKAGRRYVFSETAPETAEVGMIWFSVTSAGIITDARVYTGSAWEAADVYMYVDGSWIQIFRAWDGILFYAGSQYEEITGGWTLKNATLGTKITSTAGGASAITKKLVNFTNYKTLNLTGQLDYGASGYAYGGGSFGLASESTPTVYVTKQTTGFEKYGTWSLDISGITGAYYVRADNGGNWGHLTIEKMWVE